MNFNDVSGLIAVVCGSVSVGSAIAADAGGRRLFARGAVFGALALVVVVLVRFVVLG